MDLHKIQLATSDRSKICVMYERAVGYSVSRVACHVTPILQKRGLRENKPMWTRYQPPSSASAWRGLIQNVQRLQGYRPLES